MPLPKLAWLATVVISFIVAALLLLADYFGYAGVASAIGVSAAINLR